MGNFQSVEVGEGLTVSSSQSKDFGLSCSVQLVGASFFSSKNEDDLQSQVGVDVC